MTNARFWIDHKGSWVKLTLRLDDAGSNLLDAPLESVTLSAIRRVNPASEDHYRIPAEEREMHGYPRVGYNGID